MAAELIVRLTHYRHMKMHGIAFVDRQNDSYVASQLMRMQSLVKIMTRPEWTWARRDGRMGNLNRNDTHLIQDKMKYAWNCEQFIVSI